MSKHVLVLGGMRSVHQALVKLGCQLTVICDSTRVIKRVTGSDTEIYHRVIGLPVGSKDSDYIEIAKAINKNNKIECIGCYQEEFQELAAKIARELGLKYMSEDSIKTLYNKFELRKKLHENDLDRTKFKIIENKSDILEFAHKVGYPIVLKPVTGTASTGVTIIRNIEDIESAISWFDQNLQNNVKMYIEEYIDGKEYSVEAVTYNNTSKIISITEKFSEENHCVELGHCVPARINEYDYSEIINYVEKLLKILEIDNGITHTEIKLTKNGPRLIETHFRLAGDNIPDLLKISTGIDLNEIAAKCTINENPLTNISSIHNSDKYACIWYMNHEIDGILEGVSGIEKVEELDYVHSAVIIRNIGSSIGKVVNSYARTGYVICEGDNAEVAISRAQDAIKQINIIVKI